MAQSTGAVEYSDVIFAEGYNSPNECPGNDTKQSNGEPTVRLELWGMRSTLLLLSLPGPLCPGVVTHDRVLLLK